MNKITTLLQNLKIFWDATLRLAFEYWYTILLTLALTALVIWWIKKCQPHKWLARVLIKTIKWLGLRTVILVETIVKKLVGTKTTGGPAAPKKISPVRIMIALLVGAIITGIGIALVFGVKFKGVKLSPTDSITPVVFLVITAVVIILLGVVVFRLTQWALAKGKKTIKPKADGKKLPDPKDWLKSPIINGLWAIAGLAFAYWLLSQIWPTFWEKWSGSAGFWWLPIALVAGFWLIGKKGGQAPTVAALIIGIAGLAVLITSCRSMWAVHKETAKNARVVVTVPQSVIERRWVYGYSKPPWVKGLQPGIRGETKPAKIIYFDEIRFDFKTILLNGTESPYQGTGYKDGPELIWKGIWSQVDPENSGEWYLKPVQFDGRIPTRFEGSKTTKTGESYNIWLRAVD